MMKGQNMWKKYKIHKITQTKVVTFDIRTVDICKLI